MSDIKPASKLPFRYEFDENEGIISADNQKVAAAHYMKRPSHLGRKDKNTVAKDLRYLAHTANEYPKLIEQNKKLVEALQAMFRASDELQYQSFVSGIAEDGDFKEALRVSQLFHHQKECFELVNSIKEQNNEDI